MNNILRSHGMQRTENFIKEFIAAEGAGDITIAIGDREGEAYRFFHSSRGDVLNGKTLCDMMSVSKVLVTAPLFHMAMDEKLLSPLDTIGKFFPYAPSDKKDIPLWMLLSHQSGMGKLVFPEFIGPDRREEAIRFQLSTPLEFEPGTNYLYSCSGFIILGFILEQVYNKPLDRLFDDRIARPLGMKNTSFNPSEDDNLIRCTRKAYDGANKCSDDNNHRLYGVSGNAGIFSCIDDMTLFGQSLLNRHEKLISEETFSESIKDLCPHTFGRALGYVYVDERYEQGSGLYSNGTVGHTGFSGTECFADFEKGIYVVSLSNTAYYAAKNGKSCMKEVENFRKNLHKAMKEDLGY